MSKQQLERRAVAKKLGIKYLFGGWGIRVFPRGPGGGVHRLFSILPLDGWVLDPDEVYRIVAEQGFEL